MYVSNMLRLPRIIFSDLDGTLVHFERHFSAFGEVTDKDVERGTATYVCRTSGAQRPCRLLPTSTMGAGLLSERTCELVDALRARGVLFVFISGARKSTMLQRLPLLPAADFAVAETGGRMYALAGRYKTASAEQLDPEWTARVEAEVGPIEDVRDVEHRAGALWDWCRELQRRGMRCDTRSYTCCFRVDCRADDDVEGAAGSEAALREAMATSMPAGVAYAQNLSKFDFFPSISGKGNAVAYLLTKLGIEASDAVAMFDDDNDLPMAAEVGHCAVVQATHPNVVQATLDNPHWAVASAKGVLATEELLEHMLALPS